MNIRKYNIDVRRTSLEERKPLINALKLAGERLYNGVLFKNDYPTAKLCYNGTKWLVTNDSESKPILTIPQAIAILLPHHFKEL